MPFIRVSVEAQGGTLHYWLPEELVPESHKVTQAVRGPLHARLVREVVRLLSSLLIKRGSLERCDIGSIIVFHKDQIRPPQC